MFMKKGALNCCKKKNKLPVIVRLNSKNHIINKKKDRRCSKNSITDDV